MPQWDGVCLLRGHHTRHRDHPTHQLNRRDTTRTPRSNPGILQANHQGILLRAGLATLDKPALVTHPSLATLKTQEQQLWGSQAPDLLRTKGDWVLR